MDIGKIVSEEFNQWVYNDENQAGDKLQVIDASDLPEIIQNVVKKYNDIHNVRLSLLTDVLKRYEQWEANMILDAGCWENEYPELTKELYDELLEIQKDRNIALGNEA